jgi:hypothetical protein
VKVAFDLGAIRPQMKLGFDAGDHCRRHELTIGIKDEKIAYVTCRVAHGISDPEQRELLYFSFLLCGLREIKNKNTDTIPLNPLNLPESGQARVNRAVHDETARVLTLVGSLSR